jgi:PleD family two-component response regulator
MVDVDEFKKVNDTYGHDVGDQVLRMVAARIEEAAGEGHPFRYGGEEFTLIYPGRSMKEVLPHLEALRKAIASSEFILRGPDRPRKKPKTSPARKGTRKTISVTASIGVAERNARHLQPAQVIRAADQALYRAKREGRNRICT